jgi:hypothetical protein
MEVSVRRTGTIIEVNYPELDLRFTASRIKADTDNCEVVIAWKMPYDTGMKSFYLRESTRLLDSWSKDKLIKSLEDRTQENPDRYNWGTIINEAFTKIIDKHREGYSAEVMDNLSEGNPRAYLVKPLLIEGVANLIWARGGSSKSYFALLFCVLVDKGWSAMGLSAKKGKALYLDWEEESDVFKQRLLAVQRGMNMNDPTTSGIVYKKMVGSLANNVESISKLIYDHGITFVVVDSVSPALQGDSNSQEVVENFFWALRQLDVTSLCIDHANKSGETTGKFEIHGSSFKTARARQVYELKKTTEANTSSVDVAWYHRKSNDSKMQGARGFQVTFKEKQIKHADSQEVDTLLDTVSFNRLQLGDADNSLLKDMSLPDLCYELIKANQDKEYLVDDIIKQIEIIKELPNLQKSVLEQAIKQSKRISLSNDRVSLAMEKPKWSSRNL